MDNITGTGLGLSMVKTVYEQASIDMFMTASTLQDKSHKDNKGLCVTLLFCEPYLTI